VRILFGCNLPSNPCVEELQAALNRKSIVQSARHGLLDFWAIPDDVDVLHIQWPEALFRWGEPKPWNLVNLQETLHQWRERAAVVVTVHNRHPHAGRTRLYDRLYRLVYAAADGFIHFGDVSREHVRSSYPDTRHAAHVVIPHGDYSCFLSDVRRSESRRHLSLKPRHQVVLSFGHHRHRHEVELVLHGFHALNARNKRLIIAGKLPFPARRRDRLRSRLYLKARLDPRVQLHRGWVPDEQLPYLLEAADALIIPRRGVLNSGNVALGFTFGVPVAGTEEGVVGEVLRETGNPVFDPANPSSIGSALQRALASDSLGSRNRTYARKHLQWGAIADQHASLYARLWAQHAHATG